MNALLQWGIIGAGGIAATVGADIAASPGSAVAAVASRSIERAESLARDLGAVRAYGSYSELAADPHIDVVYVATPHAQHAAAATVALQAGKPVLVEKPIGLNAAQARRLAGLAGSKGLLCVEGMWTRLNPAVQAARGVIASGSIGELRSVRSDLSHIFDYHPSHRLFDPEVGGGALLDLGVYPAALAWLFLGRPDGVEATATMAPTGVDQAASLWWTYTDGRSAQLTCSAVSEAGSTTTLIGTKGWIELASPSFRPESLTVCDASGSRTLDLPPVGGNGYALEVAEVERCLAAGLTESPAIPLDASIGVMDVLDEARRQIGVRYPNEEN